MPTSSEHTTLPLPRPELAWVSVFRATGSSSPTVLHTLLSTPGFDPCAIAEGWTLPWAALGDLEPLGALWKGPDPEEGMEALLEALVDAGAPWRALHPIHGFDLLDVAVALNLPRLLTRLLARPDAPTPEELQGRRAPPRILPFAKGGAVALPWLHACLSASRLELFSVLIGHGFDPNVPDSQGWTPLFRAFEVTGAQAALDAGAEADVEVAGLPLARQAWLHLPVSNQKALKGLLTGISKTSFSFSVEDAFEMLAVHQPEGIKSALQLLSSLPPAERVPAQFSRKTAKVSWGPLGWIAQSWWQRCSNDIGSQQNIARNFANVMRGLRRLIADRTFWQHESLPGIPDGVLAVALLLAYAHPNLNSYSEFSLPLARVDYEKVLKLSLPPHRGQTGAIDTDPRVWTSLEAVHGSLAGKSAIPRALQGACWGFLARQLRAYPQDQWPWASLSRVLADPAEGTALWETLCVSVGQAVGPAEWRLKVGAVPHPEKTLNEVFALAGPPLWDALILLAKPSESSHLAATTALKLAQRWLTQDPSVAEGLAQRPLFTRIRQHAKELAWPVLDSHLLAAGLGKTLRPAMASHRPRM